MKALILNGETADSRIAGNVFAFLESCLGEQGFLYDTLTLAEMEIACCTGCFGCWVKTPGICVIDDEGREVTKKAVRSDLVIFVTPVIFGGYSSELKRGLDRIIGFVSPFFERVSGETHHKMRYSALPRVLAFGLMPEYDELSAKTFHTLVKRNGINMRQKSVSGILVTDLGFESMKESIRGTLKGVLSEQ